MGSNRHIVFAFLVGVAVDSAFSATDVNVLNIPSVREVNASAHYTWDYWGAVGSGANGQQRLTDIKNDLDTLRQALSYHFRYQSDGIPVSQNVEDIANYLTDLPNILSRLGDIRDDVDDIRIISEEFRNPMFRLNNSFLRASESGANKLWVTSGVENAIATIPDLISSNNVLLAALLNFSGVDDYPFSASFLSDSMVHGKTYLKMYQDIWYDSTNLYWQLLNRDYGLWQAIAMQPFFDYDISQLDGKNVGSPILGLEKYDYYDTFRTIFGTGDPQHDANFRDVLSFFEGGLGKLKMKYYGTYPTYVAFTNFTHNITNGLPNSLVNASWFNSDDEFDFAPEQLSNITNVVATSVNTNTVAGFGVTNTPVWAVNAMEKYGLGEMTSYADITNYTDYADTSESYDSAVSTLTNRLMNAFDTVKSSVEGAGVFTIRYAPYFSLPSGVVSAETVEIDFTVGTNYDFNKSVEFFIVIGKFIVLVTCSSFIVSRSLRGSA